MSSYLRVDRDGAIATVSLLAPTMAPALFTELGEVFAGLAGDAALRAVIVRGDTKVFSYGLDLQAAFAAWGPTFSGAGLAAGRTELWKMIRETKVAIVADLGSLQRLPLVIGDAATRELALTGKDIDAARALALGLVSQVVADRDALEAAARALAGEIAANPPLVVRGVKQILDQATRGEVAEGLERVATWNAAFLPSEDLGEAASAFAARRPPIWKGR